MSSPVNTNAHNLSVCQTVISQLQDHQCYEHGLPYEFLCEGKLACKNCKNSPQSYTYNLQCILQEPIMLRMNTEYIDKFYKHIICDSIMINGVQSMKKTLTQLLDALKKQINEYCDNILTHFQDYEKHIHNYDQLRIKIEFIKGQYRRELYELLQEQFETENAQWLEKALKKYQLSDQNDASTLHLQCKAMLEELQKHPLINWQAILKIYQKVTDEQLWEIDRIIRNVGRINTIDKQPMKIIIPNKQAKLNKQFILRYGEQRIQLYRQQQNEQGIQRRQMIDQVGVKVDNLYQINRHRLIGYNYHQIIMISYAFGHLTIINKFALTGCTDMLMLKNHLIVNSQGKLIRIQLSDQKYQVLGVGYNNLKYCYNNCEFQGQKIEDKWFNCTAQNGQQYRWSIYNSHPDNYIK